MVTDDSTVPSRAGKSQSGDADGRPFPRGSAGVGRAGGGPRWWTVVVPCLLTLPMSAWALLIGVFAGLNSTDGGPDPGPIPGIGVAEFFVGVLTIGTLIAALAWRPGRRGLRRVLWAGCLLDCAGLAVVYAWASAHP